MAPSKPVRHLATVLGISAGACGISESDTFMEPGIIVSYGDTAGITVPDSIARGATFQVSVATFAGGCTREIARTDYTVSATLIEIRPFNRTKRSQVCWRDLLMLTHTVTVRIDEPGPAVVRIIAAQRPPAAGAPVQVDQTITAY
jgi:hypothetical protein